MQTAEQWKDSLSAVARPEKAAILSKFFKTGKGEYGEGDKFIGIVVPDNRKIARQAARIALEEIEKMLASDIHEHRLSGLLALVERYRKSRDSEERKSISDFYLSHTEAANNWDLVDLSAPYIIGTQLLADPAADITPPLCESDSLWEQRIAIVATITPIRAGQFDIALRNIVRLLHHPHDLIQKANGWMLREIGKKDESVLRQFLDRHAGDMPRTTLRYAVERLSPEKKKCYMSRKSDLKINAQSVSKKQI